MRLHVVWCLALAAAAAMGQDAAPVPVEKEPHHKTVFQNDFVQAFRVNIDPGQATLMHIHSHDDGAVRLGTFTSASDVQGQPPGKPEEAHPGGVSARNNEPNALVHRVRNVGTTPFDVIDVQVLGRPPGPATDPIATPAAENPKMRVYRWDLAPGATSAMHTHKRPYLIIAATDTNLKMTSPDGRSMEHPIKAGDMHWVDTEVTHSLANTGTETAVMVEFEIK
jgi:quercetin dioxygenase-like cupin family protein